MKINKILALLLVLCLALGMLPAQITAHAEDNYQFLELPILANEKQYSECVIVRNNILYMDAQSVEKYTNYCFSETEMRFIIKGQTGNVFKSVLFSPETKKLVVRLSGITYAVRTISLENVIKYNNRYYLPVHKLLPCLDVFTEVKDGALVIEAPFMTMASAMYGFNSRSYYFDMEKEFAGKFGLILAYILPNYVYDTVIHRRLHRLLIDPNNKGSYYDYEKVLSSLVQNDDTYLRAMAGIADNTVSNPAARTAWDIYCKSHELLGTFDNGFEVLEHYGYVIQAGEQYYDLRQISGIAGHDTYGNIANNVIDVVNYAIYYNNQIGDHYNMLDAVYNASGVKRDDILSAINDAEYYAADNLLTIYSKDEQAKQLGIVYTALNSFIDNEGGLLGGTYTKLLDLAAYISDRIPKLQDSEKIALLHYYIQVARSASTALAYYESTIGEASDENINNIRLCAIMYLLANRECYSILDRSGVSGSYTNIINNINARLIALYQCAVSTEVDSFEHIEKNAKTLKKQLSTLIKKLNTFVPSTDTHDSEPTLNDDPFYSSGTPLLSIGNYIYYISYHDMTAKSIENQILMEI